MPNKSLSIKRLSIFITMLEMFLSYFFLLLCPVRADESGLEKIYSSSGVNVSMDTASSENLRLKGKKITLDLSEVGVVDVLKFLSSRGGIDIVISKNINGKINLFLKDITIEEAMEIIVLSSGLAYVMDGAMNVMTDAEYSAIYGESFREKKSIKTVNLKHVPLSLAKQLLLELKDSDSRIILDTKQESVILIDAPEKLKHMEELIRLLDKPPLTKIFHLKYGDIEKIEEELNAFITKGFGNIQYDKQANKITISELPFKIDRIEKFIVDFEEKNRKISLNTKIVQVILDKKHHAGINLINIFSSVNKDAQNIELLGKFEISGMNNILEISKTSQAGNILQLLKKTGEVQNFQDSKITAFNGKETNVFYADVKSFDITVNFYLTPVIKDDESVILKIKPDINPEAKVNPADMSNIVIKEGETLVINGLMREEKVKEKSGIPVLKKIPILKLIFSWNVERMKKKEILIFITPDILDKNTNLSGD